jgi:hypothetical protein
MTFGSGRVVATSQPTSEPAEPELDADHILIGIPRISRFVGLTQGQTRHRLLQSQLPGCFKVGNSHAMHVGATESA